MPSIRDSHLTYITNSRLATGINNRYATLEKLIKTYMKPGESILELFAGCGISTGLYLELVKPSKITSMDIHEDCYEELKRKYGERPEVTVLHGDAFEYTDLSGYSWVIIDSLVNLSCISMFDRIFELLSKTDCKVCMTDTSNARCRFMVRGKKRTIYRKSLMEKYNQILTEKAKLQIRHGYFSETGSSFLVFDRDLSNTEFQMEMFSTEKSIYKKFLPIRDGALC